MGGKSSKPTESSATTTVAYITSQAATIGSDSIENSSENCSCIMVILAFFSGVLVTLLILALIYCLIKVKQKGKPKPTVSPDRNNKVSSSTVFHMAPNENITYATLNFEERKSTIYHNNQDRPLSTKV
ncbi:transmembrane protein C1orf162 homolog [Pyxicephalus adspersus]|uniref:transmembrane protein C1orf162 homolog n=1 Tax=Pyxicephalus adspersus TaxID=30357 RepID=UPI003B5B7571